MKWKSEKLSNLTINLDNKRIPLNATERGAKTQKQLYPYIGANNILCYIDEYLFDEEILCLAEDGGSWGANEKCAFIYNEKCWVNNHTHVLRSNGSSYLPYLRFYLNYANLNSYINGTTRGKLTQKALDSIQIPLPPLDDQIAIANILTKAEKLIAKRKESLRALDEFLKSTFLEMFGDPVRNEKGWERVSINDLCSRVFDCPHNTPEYSETRTGFYCIRSPDIQDGYLNLNDTLQVDLNTFNDRNARHIPKVNDIVFTREGGRLGNAARIPANLNVCLGQRIMLFAIEKNKATSEFLWASLNSASIQQCIKGLAGGGAAPRVNIKDIINVKLISPPLAFQNEFAAIVEKVESTKEKYSKSLVELENLYGSLSQRAFKGEL